MILKKLFILIILILLVGCAQPKSDDEKVIKLAQDFAVSWDSEDYDASYDLIHSSLTNLRERRDFVTFSNSVNDLERNIIVFDGIEKISNTSYKVTYSKDKNGIYGKIVKENDEWKIIIFEDHFKKDCIINDCQTFTKNELKKNKVSEIDSCMKKYSLDLNICRRTIEDIIQGIDEVDFTCDKTTSYTCDSGGELY